MARYMLQDDTGLYLEKLEVKMLGENACWGVDWTIYPEKALKLTKEEAKHIRKYIKPFSETAKLKLREYEGA